MNDEKSKLRREVIIKSVYQNQNKKNDNIQTSNVFTDKQRNIIASKNTHIFTTQSLTNKSKNEKLVDRASHFYDKISDKTIDKFYDSVGKNVDNASDVDVRLKIFKPVAKAPLNIAKGTTKTARRGAAIIRKMKIDTILNSSNNEKIKNLENETMKAGFVAILNFTTGIVGKITQSIGRHIIKVVGVWLFFAISTCMPLLLVLVAMFTAAGSEVQDTAEDTASGTSDFVPISGDIKTRVIERAKTYSGQTGDAIFEYYGMKNHWCCMFVWTCFNIEDAEELFYDGDKTAYCPDIDAWALENTDLIVYYKNNATGETIGDPTAGTYGDLVLWDYPSYNNNSDHIGFIESYNPETTYYTTIEGNTGGTSGNNDGGYLFYTTSKVNIYTTSVSSGDKDLHLIIRPDYSSFDD